MAIGKFYPLLLRFTNYIEIMQVKNSDYILVTYKPYNFPITTKRGCKTIPIIPITTTVITF